MPSNENERYRTFSEDEFEKIISLISSSKGTFISEPISIAGVSTTFYITTTDGVTHSYTNNANAYLVIDGESYSPPKSWLNNNFKGYDKGNQPIPDGFWERVNNQDREIKKMAHELYKYKTAYVGDASKVGGIIKNLPINKFIPMLNGNGMELFTKEEPYGLAIDYTTDEKTGNSLYENQDESAFVKSAIILFSLVDNLEYVQFRITYGDKNSYLNTVHRDGLTSNLNPDVRLYANDEDGFVQFVLMLIDSNYKELYNSSPRNLTKNDVIALSKKGYELTWVDFEKFVGKDIGSGLYIMRYDIDNNYYVLVGGVPHEKPWYVRLYYGETEMIDIRSDDVQEFINKYSQDISYLIENKLDIIMSSPKEASNVNAYIDLHKDEYAELIAIDYDMLIYSFTQFELEGKSGLKEVIMVEVCKEILKNDQFSANMDFVYNDTAIGWYNALKTYVLQKQNSDDEHFKKSKALQSLIWTLDTLKSTPLPDFSYSGDDEILRQVYETETQKYQGQKYKGNSFLVVAPFIVDTYQDGDVFKVFTVTFASSCVLYGDVVDQYGGSVIPTAITYKKNSDASYSLEKYERAMDGGDFGKSVREFCTSLTGKEIPGLAEKMISYDQNAVNELMHINLTNHLKNNNLSGIKLKLHDGEFQQLN